MENKLIQMKNTCLLVTFLFIVFAPATIFSQENINRSKFKQLGQELPTPNTYRTASGAPGHEYWQQRADYVINVKLNDENQSITGSESITYYNNSPDDLKYLWVQLDQNVRAKNSDSYATSTSKLSSNLYFEQLERHFHDEFDGGFKIKSVKDRSGKNLPFTINKTMMRVDLPTPLKPGSNFTLSIDWYYNIQDQRKMGGRSGYEFFEEDSNYLYEIAQWFPRMAVYNDVEGWQHKQFLGRGEFTLPFGDYKVSITVPADHLVSATGELENPYNVLTSTQRNRLKQAETAESPVLIITPEEAKANEKSRSKQTKTWVFKADNVRDFAWASSRKFIWDAKGVDLGKNKVISMSFYPNEGNPLWEKYSTRAIEHTLKVYSKYTIEYPYPVAISVNGPVGGMEYPMICFNGPRPEEDGTYSERTKYALISVIIHEVGHNFFPMIINSDERQWTWMDEGLNTYVQFLAEQEWEKDYPSRRGPANKIVHYMKGEENTMMPIMTNSESILQFGNNAYGKPATALNILRESVMGRELFDFAFKTYCERWAFKHPTPADLFRTIEDASSVDLDWFWRGWFYTTDNVDISIDEVKWYRIDTKNPEVEKPLLKTELEKEPKNISMIRYAEVTTLADKDSAILDFYNRYDPLEPTKMDQERYTYYYNSLSDKEKEILNSGLNFYEIDFSNRGGLVMPIILEFEFEDGTKVVKRIPAEIWKQDNYEVTKVFHFTKTVKSILLDPFLETADIDMKNNYYPRRMIPSRFELFKKGERSGQNIMQIHKEYEKKKEGQKESQ